MLTVAPHPHPHFPDGFGPRGFSPAFPFRQRPYQIAKKFAGYLVRPARELCSRYGLPASAHTQPGRVGWGLNRPFGQVGGKPFRVVALDKAASSRWPRIFADDGRTATAFAGFRHSGRLLVGHGLLAWLARALTLDRKS